LLQAAGGVEERIGNYTGARLLYAASLSIEPSAPTVLALAMLEIRHPVDITADLDRAKGLFEEALLLDPRHGPVYNAYGNMERRRGNSEEARRIYKQGVRAECNDPASVFHGFAQLELSVGNVDIARAILNEGLLQVENQARFMDSSRHERAVFLVHTLGMVELNTNRALDASIVFKEGVKKHGNCSQLLLGAALSEVKLGNEDKAREWFERAARADKRHAQAWQAWGVMEMRAGHHAAAKSLFESGIKNSPRHGALYHAYGNLEGRMGNTENARVLFKAGLKKCPDHVSLYQGWASIEVRDGNLLRAKRLIGEALTRDKTHGSGWLIAADIEERQGNVGLVGLLLRRGIECAPFDPNLYRAYGEYLVRNGEINKARNVLEKGLEINPTHAPLYHSLAELEARVFNLEGLAKLNKRAAKIFSNNAMEPTASSSQVFGDRMRDQHRRALPNGEMIGENEAIERVTSSFDTIRQIEEEFLLFEQDESLGNSDF
jgi:tetratricopeptide (TPR) repeat protein